MKKKILGWTLFALAIFVLVKSPDVAASLAQKAGTWLGDAANSASVFVDRVSG